MLRMLADKIAVIPIEDPDQIGSIIVPKEAKRRSDQGIIKYRGDDVKELRVGDHVLFSAYTGDRVQVQDEGEMIIMKEKDVVALLTGQSSGVLYTREQAEEFLVSAIQETTTTNHIPNDLLHLLAERFRAQFDAYETVRV